VTLSDLDIFINMSLFLKTIFLFMLSFWNNPTRASNISLLLFFLDKWGFIWSFTESNITYWDFISFFLWTDKACGFISGRTIYQWSYINLVWLTLYFIGSWFDPWCIFWIPIYIFSSCGSHPNIEGFGWLPQV
jgi:hypothetical protein